VVEHYRSIILRSKGPDVIVVEEEEEEETGLSKS